MVKDLILDQIRHQSERSFRWSFARHELGLTLKATSLELINRIRSELRIGSRRVPLNQKEAKKTKATIYFGDESGVRSDYHCGTTWLPRAKLR